MCKIKYSILIYFHGQFSTNFLYIYCLSQVCSSLACFSFESLFLHPSFYLGFFYCLGWKVDYKLQLPRVQIEFSFVMPWKASFLLKSVLPTTNFDRITQEPPVAILDKWMVKNNKAAVTEVLFQRQRHAKEDVFTQDSFRTRIDFFAMGKMLANVSYSSNSSWLSLICRTPRNLAGSLLAVNFCR